MELEKELERVDPYDEDAEGQHDNDTGFGFMYEDEILPEIEVREAISLDQMMREDTAFVAFSHDDIVVQMKQLLKMRTGPTGATRGVGAPDDYDLSAKAYARLHKSVIGRVQADMMMYVSLHIDAIRKRRDVFSSSSVPALLIPLVRELNMDDADAFVMSYDDALKAPYYNLQQSELNKLAMPFIYDQTVSDDIPKLDSGITVNVTLDPALNDVSKIIDSDIASLPLIGVAWKAPVTSHVQNVADTDGKPKTPKSDDYVTWSTVLASIGSGDVSGSARLNDWLRYVRPSFEATLKKHVKNIQDLHSLELALSRDGVCLDELDSEHFDKLVEHLLALETNEEGEGEGERERERDENAGEKVDFLHRFVMAKRYQTFIDVLSSVRAPDHTRESYEKRDLLREACGSYIMQSQAHFDSSSMHGVNHPYVMAMALLHRETSMEDVVKIVRDYCSQVKVDRVKEFMDAIKRDFDLDTDANIGIQERMIASLKKTGSSIAAKTDDVNQFVATFSEIAEIVEGNDTSMYDGTPVTNVEVIFQEQENADMLSGMDDGDAGSSGGAAIGGVDGNDMEKDALDSMRTDVLLADSYPALKECNVGSSEVLRIIIPMLVNIRDASALPWSHNNIDAWIRRVAASLDRKSRAQQIKDVVEEVSLMVAESLCATTETATMYRIRQMANKDLSARIAVVYPGIHREWLAACANVLTSGLTEFMLECLEKSLKGTLEFSILNGMVSLINVWSPYGLPLDEDDPRANKTTGILQYILGVAKQVQSQTATSAGMGTPSLDDVLAYARAQHAERIDAVKAQWQTIKDRPDSMSKAELAKISLIAMVESLRAKQAVGNAVSTFVNAFVYLPNLLPSSDAKKYAKQAAWGRGCCTAQINSDYEADVDWKNHVSTMWKIKQSLAKDRWITKPRKVYATFVRKQRASKNGSNKRATNDGHNGRDGRDGRADVGKFVKPELHDSDAPSQSQSDHVARRSLQELLGEWILKEDADAMQVDALQGAKMTNDIVTALCSRKQANLVTEILESITDADSVIRILCNIAANIQAYASDASDASDASNSVSLNLIEARNTVKTMKVALTKATNEAKTSEESKDALRYSKYVLAVALCLPASPQRSGTEIRIDVHGALPVNVLPDLVAMHVKSFDAWKKAHHMPSSAEIQAYVNKIREEQKNITLAKYNRIGDVDELQLMKDMKRFGLKVPEARADDESQGGAAGDNDAEVNMGEAEFAQSSTDRDANMNDLE